MWLGCCCRACAGLRGLCYATPVARTVLRRPWSHSNDNNARLPHREAGHCHYRTLSPRIIALRRCFPAILPSGRWTWVATDTDTPPLPLTLWATNQINGIAPRSTMLLTVSSSVRFSPNRFGLPPCPCQSEPPVTSRWWREAISSRRRRCWGGLPRCHTSSPSSPASISCPIWSSDNSTGLRLGSPA